MLITFGNRIRRFGTKLAPKHALFLFMAAVLIAGGVLPFVHRTTQGVHMVAGEALPKLGTGGQLQVGADSEELPVDLGTDVMNGGPGPRTADHFQRLFYDDSYDYVKLRASAIVISNGTPAGTLCLVSVDVCCMTKDDLDSEVPLSADPNDIGAARRIAKELSIPFDNIMVTATHTHGAPSMVALHGCPRDDVFAGRVRNSIVTAAINANNNLTSAQAYYTLCKLDQYGATPQGSADDSFDADFPVLAFKDLQGHYVALLFSHGAHSNNGYSFDLTAVSPGIYGLAARELEYDGTVPQGFTYYPDSDSPIHIECAYCPDLQWGYTDGKGVHHNTTVSFFSGCIGGAYFDKIGGVFTVPDFRYKLEAVKNTICSAVQTINNSQPISDTTLAATKSSFTYYYRNFDPLAEKSEIDAGYVTDTSISPWFRQDYVDMYDLTRAEYEPKQGQPNTTWIQAVRIGNVFFAGLPGEMFPYYGQDIKGRLGFAPYQDHTFTLGLTNDYIGYMPNDATIDAQYYQAWTASHSFANYNTGNLLANQAVTMLTQLGGGTPLTLKKGPHAHFAAARVVDPPLTIQFWDQSTSSDGIVSWSWNFGEGSTSAQQNPTYTYHQPGTYTVSLTVTEADGDAYTKKTPMDVSYDWGYMTESDGSGGILLRQREQTCWTQGWDKIIPGDFNGDGITDLLFWDKDAGSAEMYFGNGDGTFDLLSTFSNWDTRWDEIIPGNFFGTQCTDLLFWCKSGNAGPDNNLFAYMMKSVATWLPPANNYRGVWQYSLNYGPYYTGWDDRWDEIIPGTFFDHGSQKYTDLLFWDKSGQAGPDNNLFAYMMKVSGDGVLSYGPYYTGWDNRWDEIVPGTFFDHDSQQYTDLLFWCKNGNAGPDNDLSAYMMKVSGDGALSYGPYYPQPGEPAWDNRWDEIIPGNFFVDTQNTDLLFWCKNGNAGPDNNLSAYMMKVSGDAVLSYGPYYPQPGQPPWSTWDNILPGDFFLVDPDLLFYNNQPAHEPIRYLQGPNANFSATTTIGATPLTVSFTSTPFSMPVAQWNWDFGDGGTSADPNPIHTYTSPGTYTVSLTVTGQDGHSATLTLASYINVHEQNTPVGTEVPVVAADPYTWEDTPVSLTFAQVTAAGDTTATKSQTGPEVPGGFEVAEPPTYYEISTTAGYTGPITIWITYNTARYSDPSSLRLLHYENGSWVDVTTSNDTVVGIICGSVTSLSPFIIAFPASINLPPTANAGGPYAGQEGTPITFDASASSDPESATLQYRWDFDNNGQWDTDWSTSPLATYTWNDDCTGSVKVEVSDGVNVVDSAPSAITISNVVPSVEAGPDQTAEVFNQLSFGGSFIDPGLLDAHTVAWDFGDGSSAVGTLTPSHTYSLVGKYTVKLTVTDDDGGVGTDTLNVQVTQKYAVWANSSVSNAIQWSGSSAQISGKVHSNGGIKMSGSQNTIGGTVYYVSTLVITGIGDHYTSSEKVSTRPMPVSYALSDYQPGGSVATQAQNEGRYHYISGNLSVSTSNVVLDGLYYVKGKVSLTGSGIRGTFTIVAEGTISITGSGLNCTAYLGDLLFFSNGATLAISGSNGTYGGTIYVPTGQINITGSGSTINGSLFADNVALSGSNTKITVR